MKHLLIKTLLINTFLLAGILTSCDAQNTHQKADQLAPAHQNKKSIGELFISAINKRSEGQLNEAIKDLDEILTRNEIHLKALYLRGLVFNDLKNFKNAIKDFDAVIQIKEKEKANYVEGAIRVVDVQEEEIRLARGISLTHLNEFEKALLDFSFCEQIDFERGMIHLYMGICHYNLKEYPKACVNWQLSNDFGDERANQYLKKYCNQ